MKTIILLLFITLTITGNSFAQTAPEPAGKILEKAYRQAAMENKNVMVVFHASWCGWCKKFDASVTDSTCKAYFDKSFVIVHLTILENGEMKKLENPGANELFENNGGKGQGIPYLLLYDKSGKLLADSKMVPAGKPNAKPANIGCPASDDEVAYFVTLLKKTSKITDKEAAAVTTRFRKNKS